MIKCVVESTTLSVKKTNDIGHRHVCITIFFCVLQEHFVSTTMGSTPAPNLHIAGVPVNFPHTPYRAQVALMHAVINAVNNQTHALVESPTGTGKSLALLCSSLAIQSHLRENSRKDQAELVSSTDRNSASTAKPVSSDPPSEGVKPPPSNKPIGLSYSNPVDSDEEDFQPQRNFRDVSWQRPISKHHKRPSEEAPENEYMLHLHDNPLDQTENPPSPFSTEPSIAPTAPAARKKALPKRVPRIFYASRTHAQVTQVVAELRKTVYRPPLSILASRREYCLNEAVITQTGRDDACKRLVAESGCSLYFEAMNLASHPELFGSAWDIEELTNLGARLSACPYYASHELYQSANLILCPYSFLVDPIVREARGINLSGDVVILDEAHNIENFAREAASFATDVADLRRVVDDIETIILTSRVPDGAADIVLAYRRLKMLLETFISLVDSVVISDNFKQRETFENAVFERRGLLQLLERCDINMEEVKYWRAAYDFIVHYGDGNEETRFKKMGTDRAVIEISPVKPALSSPPRPESTQAQSDATKSGSYGYGYDSGAQSNARTVDETGSDSGLNGSGVRRGRFGKKMRKRSGRRNRTKDGLQERPWMSKCMAKSYALLTTLAFLFDNPDDFILVVDRRTVDFVTVVNLSIHCLNAAVSFRDISSKARSVIVTSGTLSPMSSFAGELGTKFAISKSLPHVINVRKQLYIGVAGEGPHGIRFEGTFHGAARFDFQDGLANALIDYCRVIPGGVLVFFPSYRMMDIMRSRWKSCGAWKRLEGVKQTVLVEPTHRGENFDSIVSQYQQAANSANGSILLAVCRGKLSEGIDFRDDTSRAVILVGIPFPYKNDTVVSQKIGWNDRARREGEQKQLQSGGEWYEMQAFRALNQALGRAVRHRYDYGAIILVDCRFRQPRVLSQLPKWTQDAVRRTDAKHETIVSELDSFYKNVHEGLASIAEERRQNGQTK